MVTPQAEQHHLNLRQGDVGRYVLLPGDPARCEAIASYLDRPVRVAANREFTTWTGNLLGEKVSVVSTGIGNPSAAIAMEELLALSAHTFIRVGTAGGMQPHQRPGDLGIVTASIRDEGTTKHYLPVEFPAVADLDVVLALRTAAAELGATYHSGISHSKDSFYGQMRPESMPVAGFLQERWKAWVQGGAICAEMESATVLTLAGIHRKRAGSITLIAVNQAHPEWGVQTETQLLIRVAIEAVRKLIQADRVGQRVGESADFDAAISPAAAFIR